MSNPWAKIQKPDPINLHVIISEEHARSLQEKEVNKIMKQNESPHSSLCTKTESLISTDRHLQIDKDNEFQQHTEEKTSLNYDSENDAEEDGIVDVIDEKHWDAFEAHHREFGAKPVGSQKVDEMVPKREGKVRGLENVSTLLSYPPLLRSRIGKFIPNTWWPERRYGEEDEQTTGFFVDENAQKLLSRMISDKLFERVNGILTVGTEALILHADADPNYHSFATENKPKEFAVKVFQWPQLDLEDRERCVKDGIRYDEITDRKHKRFVKKSRKNGGTSAENEMVNLKKLSKAGVLCPQVLASKHPVVVMSFIGENRKPAPMLKDLDNNVMNKQGGYTKVYNQVIDAMKKMYQKANLIHTDLSDFNILWHNEKCYIIDTSRAVEPSHRDALDCLMRDCINVLKFFSKKQVPNLLTPVELFEDITGIDYNDKPALLKIQDALKTSKLDSNATSDRPLE